MKKLIFAFALVFGGYGIAVPAFAAVPSPAVSGQFVDEQGEALKDVKIQLKEEDVEIEASTSRGYEFSLPERGKNYDVVYTLEDYFPVYGYFRFDSSSKKYTFSFDTKRNGYQQFRSDKQDKNQSFTVGSDSLSVNPLTMYRKPYPVLTITVQDKKENKPLYNARISGTVSYEVDGKKITEDLDNYTRLDKTTDPNGKLALSGFNDVKRKYDITVSHDMYKEIPHNLVIKADEKKEITIELKDKSAMQIYQEEMVAMTGYDCEDVTPKYLIGAKCQGRKKTLKGDASDITYWIQQITEKIAMVAGSAAVLYIIYCAFRIVTAVGQTDQIQEAKQGIVWAAFGLLLISFAYLIVKTIISLTY